MPSPVTDLSTLRVTATAAPLRKLVADKIRAAVIEGKFKPGDRLKEGELCSLTGVSRTVVREALRQLEAEGVVGNIPNRGPVVARVTPEEAKSHYAVRAALEALAARTAATVLDDAQAQSMRTMQQELVHAVESKDVARLLDVKNRIDSLILSACNNSLLEGFLDVIHARLAYLRPLVLSQPQRLAENLSEVQRIIEAIVARDPDRAAQAALEHVQNGAAATLALLDSREPGT